VIRLSRPFGERIPVIREKAGFLTIACCEIHNPPPKFPGDALCHEKVAFSMQSEVISITELDKLVSQSSRPVPLINFQTAVQLV
jgi:hypothetical protein